jgi:hypothetical protein
MVDTVKAEVQTSKVASETPIILDLGKKKRKQIKQLKKGTGKLMTEVQDCIQELKQAGRVADHSRPVIVLVRERRRKLMLPRF